MEKTWRLILDEALEPRLNMAIDEAIMLCQSKPDDMPVFRIYKWLCPCVSVGRFQYSKLSLQAPCDDRIIIRRPTGGGAVFHKEAGFTYSVIYREDSGVAPKGVKESYRQIHMVISNAFKRLGIKMDLYRPSKGAKLLSGGECFISPVEYDLICCGQKIAGAAQRRKFGVVLHQGEICLPSPQNAWCKGLGLDVWPKWSYNKFLSTLTDEFSRRFRARFLKGHVSETEKKLAEELAAQQAEEVNK